MAIELNYTPKERLKQIIEILAEGCLESLNIAKHFDFYKAQWEQAALTCAIGVPKDDGCLFDNGIKIKNNPHTIISEREDK